MVPLLGVLDHGMWTPTFGTSIHNYSVMVKASMNV